MVKATMESISDNCTGCQLCQMACSFLKTTTYSPSRALIQIDRMGNREKYAISFREGCDACGYCTRFCAFDAIQRRRRI